MSNLMSFKVYNRTCTTILYQELINQLELSRSVSIRVHARHCLNLKLLSITNKIFEQFTIFKPFLIKVIFIYSIPFINY